MDVATLVDLTNKLGEKLSDISKDDFEYTSFDICCQDLPVPKYEGESIYRYSHLKDFFSSLNTQKGYPFVYWFEITSDISCEDVRHSVSNYANEVKNEVLLKTTKFQRNFYGVPAMTKHIKDRNSRVLYVGKVKKDLAGRLVPHLGYYHRSPNTQGLQLARWAKELNLNLKFHFIRLPKELIELTSFYEFQIAKDLKPILGKHSG